MKIRGRDTMSRINDIESRLKQLEGGKFQNLCNELLYALEYGKITNSGGEIATDKTIKGTPDAYILQSNGKLIFIEYTVQQKRVFEKFEDDINKCLDESKTKVSLDNIEKIIIMYNSILSVDKLKSLEKMCTSRNIKFEHFDISNMAQYINNQCAYLAKEYLEVPLDSGQMLNISKFIQYNDNNSISTPLGIQIYNRETQLIEILNELEKKNSIILSGKAGVGKTRLSLEVCKEYKKKYQNCIIWCIKNNGQNLYEDIKRNITNKGRYLIFIDDANQTYSLDIILSRLNEKEDLSDIKIIATVRDYALKNVVETFQKYTNPKRIKIENLEDETIRKVAEEHFNIKHPIYLERIQEISKGNARIAVMASKVAAETNKYESIQDVSRILEEYYMGTKKEINILDDSNILKTIGLICFLNIINLQDKSNIEKMCNIANIKEEEFKNAIFKLHILEIVDIYENQVVKISDQVLMVYLFKLVFIEKELLDYSKCLYAYFPKLKRRVIELLNAVYTYYNNDDVIIFFNKNINIVWDKMSKSNDCRFNDFMLTFCSVRELETLLYIKRYIEKLVPKYGVQISYDIKKKGYDDLNIEIVTLVHYKHSDSFNDALSLICEYLDKIPEDFRKIYYLLIDGLGIDKYSYYQDYSIQIKVVNEVIKYSKEWSDNKFTMLFLRLAQKFLQFRFEPIENKGNSKIILYDIGISATKGSYKFRNIIWSSLVELIRIKKYRKDVVEVLDSYSRQRFFYKEIDTEILINDSKKIKKIINEELIYINFKECVIADKILNNINRYCDELKNIKIQDIYKNEEFEVYKVLKKKRFLKDFNYEQEQELRKIHLQDYVYNFNSDDFNSLFIKCKDFNSSEEYEILQSLRIILTSIKDDKIFNNVVELYIKNNTPFNVHPKDLINRLIEVRGLAETENLIRNYEYDTKSDWLFYFFEAIPESCVNKEYLNKIIDYFTNDYGDLHGWSHDLQFLQLYKKLEPNIVGIVISKIVDRFNEDSFRFRINLESLFNHNTNIYKEFIQINKNNIEIFKSAYINMLLISNASIDYNCEILKDLIKLDNMFLNKILNIIIENRLIDEIELSFVWDLDEYSKIVNSCFDYLERSSCLYYYILKCIKNIFSIDKNNKEILIKQDLWLRNYIENNAFDDNKMNNIFKLICNFTESRRIDYILVLMKINSSINLFNKINIEPTTISWSGSEVPIISKRIQYYEKIIKSLNGITYIEHRSYLEDLNRRLKVRIEKVKIEEFLREY